VWRGVAGEEKMAVSMAAAISGVACLSSWPEILGYSIM